MALLPTQANENSAYVRQPLSLEALPFPLSSRPKRSVVERSLCGCSVSEMFFDRSVAQRRDLRFTRSQADSKPLQVIQS
jgi:hypothetical protein